MSGILFSDSLDLRLAAFMFALILIFTLVWEDLTQRLEDKLADQIHFLQMLSKVYREMMILGFISLAVVLSNEFHLIHDHNALIHFEFAHLLAFFWALVYVLNSLVSTFRLRMTRIDWDITANLATEDVCRNVEQRMVIADPTADPGALLRPDELAMKFVSGARGLSWRPFWFSLLPFSYEGWQQIEWKILQKLFQRDFKLPGDFDYTQYLRLKLLQAMGHQLHVSVTTWGIVLGLTLLYVAGAYLYAFLNPYAITDCVEDEEMMNSTNDTLRRALGGAAAADAADDWNPDCVRRRQLGGGPGLSEAAAWSQLIFQLLLAWVLVAGQTLLLLVIKSSLHKFFMKQALFLRELEAQLTVRGLLRSIPLFEIGGEDFFDELSRHLEVKFYNNGEDVMTQGDAGDSMFFIIAGVIQLVEATNNTIIGTLGPGDYCGEMALLLEAPRTKTLRTDGMVVVAVLTEEQLVELETDFEDVISAMREAARRRQEVAGFDKQRKLAEKSSTVHGHSTGDHGGGHGGGHQAHGLMPGGMGGPKHHGCSHHGKHEFADEIMPKRQTRYFTILQELTLLLNCFQCSYYTLHVLWVVVPGTHAPFLLQLWMHLLFAFPALAVMIFMSPMVAKYQCLLTNVLYRDDELIAEIAGKQQKVISMRNNMRATLMHCTLLKKHSGDNVDDEITVRDVALHVFEELDVDNGGTLTYKELHIGLPEYGVYLTKTEFREVCRMIDPDQSGGIDTEEWLNFMQATDSDIESNDFRDALSAVKMRKKINKALLDPAMKEYYELAMTDENGHNPPPPVIDEIVEKIFKSLDLDNSGGLDYDELKGGLASHGVDISLDEYKKLVVLIDVDKDGILSLTNFTQFLSATDDDLQRIEAIMEPIKAVKMSRTDSTGIFEIEGGETSNPLADGAMADEVTGSVNET